ncbi:WD repeat-containing protein [Gloeobacter kilaueensis JS1]|uniref:WD repeat-containing protein n=1 Tax=Gloeobacter kilaueensis (strain ATCC BAA-2537 / CCAP 1431/1 / ULC 316 / JS1) TaxID=1183438 RepID=U5QS06_GLOK1|nr:WD repeat-containing protein [Gloeobacter kilaueensis JS1]
MPPVFSQILYTSLPEAGFQLLATADVSEQTRQAFTEAVVLKHWDGFRLIPTRYQLIYLHQPAPEQIFFGWLFCDRTDEMGRRVPYFLSYVLTEAIDAAQLDNIFTCLRKGPLQLIDPLQAGGFLGTVEAPNLWRYRAARPGVAVPSSVREECHRVLLKGERLDHFAESRHLDLSDTIDEQTCARLSAALAVHLGPVAEILVRQSVVRTENLPDPEQRRWQILQQLSAELDDPIVAAGFRAQIEPYLFGDAHRP